jgi:hypothetical protein
LQFIYNTARQNLVETGTENEKKPEMPELLMTEQQRFFNFSLNCKFFFNKVRNSERIVVCSAISAVYLDRLETRFDQLKGFDKIEHDFWLRLLFRTATQVADRRAVRRWAAR